MGELVEMVAGKQQEATMQGSKRPFGSSILVAGLISSTSTSSSSSNGNNGSSNGRGNKRKGSNFSYPRIYRTDPSGSYSLWKACAIGQGSEKVMALLEDKYHDQMTTKEALELALECCRIFDKDLKSSTITTTTDEDQEKKGGNGETDSNEKASVGVKTVETGFFQALPSVLMAALTLPSSPSLTKEAFSTKDCFTSLMTASLLPD